MSKPQAPKGQSCPLWQKDVSKVCHTCPWYILVRGSDPNTGKEIDTWDCSIAWLPTLLLNTAQETRQGAAATESFRNEMVKAHEQSVQVMAAIASAPRVNPKLIEG